MLVLLLAQAAAPDAPAIGQPQSPPAVSTDAPITEGGPGRLGRRLVPFGSDARGDDSLTLTRVPEDLPPVVDRRRGETVAERSRPDYDPVGLRSGAFTLYPEAGVDLGFDSNVYRQEAGQADVFTQLRAGAALKSNFSRHALLLEGSARQRLYGQYGTEDALTYDAHVMGRLDANRTDRITGEVRHSHSVVERGAAGEILQTRRPVRFDATSIALGGRKVFNRLTVDVSGLVSYLDYDDAESPLGVPINQQFRDFHLYQLRGDVGYATAGGQTLFVSVTGEARRFRVSAPPIDRDADVIEVLGGVRSEITPLIRGQLGIGYLHANFRDPTIRSRGALGIDVSLDYLYSELTTFRLSARRALQNVASANAPAALVTEARFGVDHELRRNIILSGGVGVQNADFIKSGGSALRFTADAGAQWLVNRNWRIDGNLGYRRRDGRGLSIARDFDEVRATVGITYRL